MGGLGLPAWWLSDAPLAVAAVAGVAGLACALWLARRELRRAPVAIVLGNHGVVEIDGEAVAHFDVAWRGPLTTLAWQRGDRTTRRIAFPDALDPAARRELRLHALRREDSAPAAVAP